MHKSLKITIGIIFAGLILWIGLIVVDAMRLKKSDFLTEPLIGINETDILYCGTYDEHRSEVFTGLGYSIEYEYYCSKSETTENQHPVMIYSEKSASFKLFGFIPIWSWKE